MLQVNKEVSGYDTTKQRSKRARERVSTTIHRPRPHITHEMVVAEKESLGCWSEENISLLSRRTTSHNISLVICCARERELRERKRRNAQIPFKRWKAACNVEKAMSFVMSGCHHIFLNKNSSFSNLFP
ncbi:hypothetical protein NPIL_116781 [Nephila pilipes]|uniref:Uncharacterized protein n=1 Tax=Nephila pilipes TaxID=299642 RepID=A0A8X6IV73_NEPPI|nr:hypothetical protein NPIL_116781 [Nephila pilipes]